MNLWQKKSIDQVLQEANDPNQRLKRSLGPLDLMGIGIASVVGTGIFVLTGVGAQMAGPSIILSLVFSGIVSLLAALIFAELAAMIPVAGSSYTFAYTSMGEFIAWIIGWDLILEYGVAVAAVAVGWAAYFNDAMLVMGIHIPTFFLAGPWDGGIINFPALIVEIFVTILLVLGTRESMTINNIIVIIKILALFLFIGVGLGHIDSANWHPFVPFGFHGIMSGAAIMFFAYIGFDAISTAAEETRNPQKDIPIGLLGTSFFTIILYVVVAAVLTGIQHWPELNNASPLSEALRSVGVNWASALVSVAAIAGMASVMLVTQYGQTRIFFSMSRDGLLPKSLANVHPRFKTPIRLTIITSIFIAALATLTPIGVIAELCNIGTLFAFVLVSVGVLVLRTKNPNAKRPFQVPFVKFVAPLTGIASLYLMFQLPIVTWVRFGIWMILGLLVYFSYSAHHSVLSKQQNSDVRPD